MVFSIFSMQANYLPFFPHQLQKRKLPISIPSLNPNPEPTRPIPFPCKATGRSRSSSSSSSSPSKTKKKKNNKKNETSSSSSLKDVEIVNDSLGDYYDIDEDEFDASYLGSDYLGSGNTRGVPGATAMPKPPAGFVVDESGNVVLVSDKRVTTIVDPANNCPLECIIRRVFRSSQGDECMLLCPLDTPVQILKSTNVDGWSAVSDDEVEAILPAAAYALAKIHMHLVHSGFCYTARGGFCFSEDDIFDFRTDDGQGIDGLPSEGVEITCFHLDGAHYMIYTPSDPLLFVAVKDQNGLLQIADDDLMEDPAIVYAIDEETQFNALVEEEAALLESMMGKR